jgi:alpha-L-glutamate ligase-like protein
MFFFSAYKQAGILGINGRNRDYILPNNPRSLYPLVDDKIETKRLAVAAGIQTPELYGVIDNLYDIGKLRTLVEGKGSFVIKPSRGAGGGGITLIAGLTPTGYRKASGVLMSESEMRYYLSNIISGMYAMTGSSDKVILEYTVKFDPMFADIAYQGVPDIRVVLYKGVPAMAMLRLPTRASDGKANLHKGGIGSGIDIGTGRTLKGVQFGQVTDTHPETGHTITGYQIPGWQKLLEMASRFYDITGLGYVGVDIVLDKDLGPMMLEVNARPGIAIQVANSAGLRTRLDAIDKALEDGTDFSTPQQRAAWSQEKFAVLNK